MSALRIIVNPNAGGGRARRLLVEVEAALRTRSAEYRIDETRSLEHAAELAHAAVDAGELPVAMGGDGLIGAVADALRRSPGAVLGVIPGGRGNDFARKLGIPADVPGACATLLDGRPTAVDVAVVGERGYLGIASAGVDSRAHEIANTTRLPLGRHVYVYAILRALATWRPARFDVTIDGATTTYSGYSVAIANSGVFGGGMYLSPNSELDDGIIEVVYFEARPKRRYLALIPSAFEGEHLKDPGVHVLSGSTVAVESDRPFTLYADGDPIGELPATVRVERAAISVLVPAG